MHYQHKLGNHSRSTDPPHKKMAAVKQRLANLVIRVATNTICRIRSLPPRACSAATGAMSALRTALLSPAKNTMSIDAME